MAMFPRDTMDAMSFFSMVDADHAQTVDNASDKESESDRPRVFYDLDGSAARALDAPVVQRKKRELPRPPKERVLAQPRPLFTSHLTLGLDDDDDDDDDADANPFAALLRPNPPPTEPVRRFSSSPVTHVTPPSATPSPPSASVVTQPKPRARVRPPRAARSLSPSLSLPMSGRTATPTRSLVPTIEAADARPSRWTRNAPTTTAKRRQSTSSAARQQAEAKRRKSMPTSLSSLDDRHRPSAPVGRRLSDVLHKATTLLSQEQSATTPEHRRESMEPVRETDDGIADTVHEMRDEPFQTQFFSPSKPRQTGSSSHRRSRADTMLAKIRGAIGDVIRKAVRKTNRDLTLLRSQGQTLLGRASHEDSASEVHQRDYVVVHLDRLVAHPHLITYDGVVQDVGMTSDRNDDDVVPTSGMKLMIVFSTSDTAQQLHEGSNLKIFAPFQIVNESSTPGMRRRRRNFLMGTSLFEVV